MYVSQIFSGIIEILRLQWIGLNYDALVPISLYEYGSQFVPP